MAVWVRSSAPARAPYEQASDYGGLARNPKTVLFFLVLPFCSVRIPGHAGTLLSGVRTGFRAIGEPFFGHPEALWTVSFYHPNP